MTRTFIFFALLCSTWLTLVSCSQGSAFWRDSGEFIVAAHYLDISHPGGFPLYAQLANFFSLIPIGPIAFRVNAFSSFVAALVIAMTYVASSLTIKLVYTKSTLAAEFCCAFLACAIFIGSASFLKQAITAEVYLLNALLLIGLYVVILKWRETEDLRWLVTAPFLAALTVGNHAASGVAIVPAALFAMILGRASLSKVLIPASLSLLAGLLLYLYIPVRAHAVPPLNTGDSRTISKFINLISDDRDRTLRDSTSTNDLDVISSPPALSVLSSKFYDDGIKLIHETSLLGAVIGAAGILFLVAWQPALATMLIIISGGTWYFFQGWDPDPWLPLFFTIAVGASTTISSLCMRLKGAGTIAMIVVSAGSLLHLIASVNLASLVKLKDYEDPVQIASNILNRVPYGAPLLTEPAWFFLKYARDIEGIREDIPLVYQPSMLFPGYFYLPAINLPQGTSMEESIDPSIVPNHDVAARLISAVSPFGPIALEAGSLNQFIAPLARFSADGSIKLLRGRMGTYEEGFDLTLGESLRRTRKNASEIDSSVASDAKHYAELNAVLTAELLADADRPEEAALILQSLCTPIPGSDCGEVALNNLGSYLNDMGKFREAEKVLLYLLQRGTSQRAAVEKNLAITKSQQVPQK